jgi:hypothetical protein
VSVLFLPFYIRAMNSGPTTNHRWILVAVII